MGACCRHTSRPLALTTLPWCAGHVQITPTIVRFTVDVDDEAPEHREIRWAAPEEAASSTVRTQTVRVTHTSVRMEAAGHLRHVAGSPSEATVATA